MNVVIDYCVRECKYGVYLNTELSKNGKVYANTQHKLPCKVKVKTNNEKAVLLEDGKIHLHIDYKVSGIGSHSCGPALLKKYQLNEKAMDFRFSIRPTL